MKKIVFQFLAATVLLTGWGSASLSAQRVPQKRKPIVELRAERLSQTLSLPVEKRSQFEQLYKQYMESSRLLMRSQSFDRQFDSYKRLADSLKIGMDEVRQFQKSHELDAMPISQQTLKDLRQLEAQMSQQFNDRMQDKNFVDSIKRMLRSSPRINDDSIMHMRIKEFLRKWRVKPSDQEIERNILRQFQRSQAQLDLRKEYYEKLRKLLSPSDIQKLYNMEKKLYERMRKEQWRRQESRRPRRR